MNKSYTIAIAQENPISKIWSILFVLLVITLGGSVGI